MCYICVTIQARGGGAASHKPEGDRECGCESGGHAALGAAEAHAGAACHSGHRVEERMTLGWVVKRRRDPRMGGQEKT
jgi:hypothetical protein